MILTHFIRISDWSNANTRSNGVTVSSRMIDTVTRSSGKYL